jgi:hypothetical protein
MHIRGSEDNYRRAREQLEFASIRKKPAAMRDFD